MDRERRQCRRRRSRDQKDLLTHNRAWVRQLGVGAADGGVAPIRITRPCDHGDFKHIGIGGRSREPVIATVAPPVELLLSGVTVSRIGPCMSNFQTDGSAIN